MFYLVVLSYNIRHKFTSISCYFLCFIGNKTDHLIFLQIDLQTGKKIHLAANGGVSSYILMLLASIRSRHGAQLPAALAVEMQFLRVLGEERGAVADAHDAQFRQLAPQELVHRLLARLVEG